MKTVRADLRGNEHLLARHGANTRAEIDSSFLRQFAIGFFVTLIPSAAVAVVCLSYALYLLLVPNPI